jgi:hypothetical protein
MHVDRVRKGMPRSAIRLGGVGEPGVIRSMYVEDARG